MREYLRRMRKEHSLTQKDVSHYVGIAESYYSLIENGSRMKKMNIQMAKRLAEIFGVPIEKILEEECHKPTG